MAIDQQSVVPKTHRLAQPVAKRPASPVALAASVGAIGFGAMYVFGFSLKLLLLGLGGFGVAAALVLWRVMNTHPGARAIDQAEATLEREAAERQRYAELKQALMRHDSPEARADAVKAQGQLDAVQTLYRTFAQNLETKFRSGEITEARYRGTGEQVFHGIIENLRILAGILRNVEDLRRSRSLTPEARLEAAESFEERRLRILAANDQALQSLAKVNAALVEVRTERNELKVDLDSSMLELKELADRAHLYSNQT